MRVAYEELGTFTYIISHDLGTPLSSIKNYTEIMIEDYGTQLPADAMDLLGKVLAGTYRMTQLSKNVLSYRNVGRTASTLKS